MGSRCLGSCCPRFALNGKSKIVSWYVPYLPPAPLTPGTQQAGRWRRPFAGSARILLLTIPARSPPLTREAAGVSLYSLPPQFWFAKPPTGACRESNVPVMLGIRLSKCYGDSQDANHQAKSSRIDVKMSCSSESAVNKHLRMAPACLGERCFLYR